MIDQLRPKPENENERLLSCPFCGVGRSQVDAYYDDTCKRWRVGCGRCGASSGISIHAEGSKESAIASWNTRAGDPAQQAQRNPTAKEQSEITSALRESTRLVGTFPQRGQCKCGAPLMCVRCGWQSQEEAASQNNDCDLLTELRQHERDYPSLIHGPLCGRAADEIERLVALSSDDGKVLCEECGVYPADLPSKICPGCEAYQEHQR